MMTEPSVCAVMLTRDRPEMAARAVRCFRAQTYQNKQLLVLVTSLDGDPPELDDRIDACARVSREKLSTGELRNIANSIDLRTDIITHFDDDDWSHPNRIAEQVAYLQASGMDAVGYREMLFWDETVRDVSIHSQDKRGEAWLYANTDPVYCLGTSLCYWRRVWEERPFPNLTTGEDFFWLQGVKGQKRLNSRGVSANDIGDGGVGVAMMIATIHGGNSASRIQPGTLEWTRTPEWDDVCRKTLEEA